jgi:hypothetical protein
MTKRGSIEKIFADPESILEAVREGARQAAREHMVDGRPMAVWRDGQVVWLPPEQFLEEIDQKSSRP